jgi:hypothetical protein
MPLASYVVALVNICALGYQVLTHGQVALFCCIVKGGVSIALLIYVWISTRRELEGRG